MRRLSIPKPVYRKNPELEYLTPKNFEFYYVYAPLRYIVSREGKRPSEHVLKVLTTILNLLSVRYQQVIYYHHPDEEPTVMTLDGFVYSKEGNTITIQLDNYPKQMMIRVPLHHTQKYRFIFNDDSPFSIPHVDPNTKYIDITTQSIINSLLSCRNDFLIKFILLCLSGDQLSERKRFFSNKTGIHVDDPGYFRKLSQLLDESTLTTPKQETSGLSSTILTRLNTNPHTFSMKLSYHPDTYQFITSIEATNGKYSWVGDVWEMIREFIITWRAHSVASPSPALLHFISSAGSPIRLPSVFPQTSESLHGYSTTT